eukprot:g7953.t1
MCLRPEDDPVLAPLTEHDVVETHAAGPRGPRVQVESANVGAAGKTTKTKTGRLNKTRRPHSMKSKKAGQAVDLVGKVENVMALRFAGDGFHDLETLAALRHASVTMQTLPGPEPTPSQIAHGIRSGFFTKKDWWEATRANLVWKCARLRTQIGRCKSSQHSEEHGRGGSRRGRDAALIPPEYVRSFAEGGDPDVLAAALLPPLVDGVYFGAGMAFRKLPRGAAGADAAVVWPPSLVAACLDAELPGWILSTRPAKLTGLPTWEDIKQEPTWLNSPELIAAAIRNGVFPRDPHQCGEAWRKTIPEAVRGSKPVILAALTALAKMHAVHEPTGLRLVDAAWWGEVAGRGPSMPQYFPEVPFDWDRDVVAGGGEAVRNDPEVVAAAMIAEYVHMSLEPEPFILSLEQWRALPAAVRHEDSVFAKALQFKQGFYLRGRGNWDSYEDFPEKFRAKKWVVIAAIESKLLCGVKQWQGLAEGLKNDSDVWDAAVKNIAGLRLEPIRVSGVSSMRRQKPEAI